MATFTHISPEELRDNPFSLIGKDWMLVTSANPGDSLEGGKDYNTMTASWGGVGILWNKPVAFVFIRPGRHTFGFTEQNAPLTLSFFPEDCRKALAYCGKESGRDGDKARTCGLTPVTEASEDGRSVWFEEARLVLKTRILYAQFLEENAFRNPSPLSCYPASDYHRMYICEITDVLCRE